MVPRALKDIHITLNLCMFSTPTFFPLFYTCIFFKFLLCLFLCVVVLKLTSVSMFYTLMMIAVELLNVCWSDTFSDWCNKVLVDISPQVTQNSSQIHAKFV